MIAFNGEAKSRYDHVFSNFAWSAITMPDGITYPTVEHAFQAQKTTNRKERWRISKLSSPGDAKRAGRHLKLSGGRLANWEDIKYDVMVRCLRLKFAQEPFRSYLLETGEEEIAEDASGWNDAEWGLGRSGKGKNLLGKALMQVRKELRGEPEQGGKTRVVHCKREPFDVYIGRGRCPRTGQLSKWGNPFEIGRDGTRQEVIAKYEEWLQKQPELLASVGELKGKVLGCWCHPKACHGDILARLADAY